MDLTEMFFSFPKWNGKTFSTSCQNLINSKKVTKIKRKFTHLLIIIFILISANSIYSKNKNKINIEEKLGAKLDLSEVFYDSNGNLVKLENLFNVPVVLAFVYYKCPGICSPLMTEIAETINRINLTIGKDYRIILISMDNREKPIDALQKKKEIFNLLNKKIDSESWQFLTGDSTNISKITKQTGFEFERVGTQFIHTTSLIFISKDGKISRYLYPKYRSKSFSILPFNFKMAVIDASEDKVIPTIGKLLAFCFSYSPAGRTYVFDILKVVGATTILTIGIVVIILVKKKKVNDNKRSI